MPELPEVETIVRTLRPGLTGARIAGVRLLRADILQPADADLVGLLTDRKIVDVRRRGKKIIFLLEDGNRFAIHLGMTGRLTLEKSQAPSLPHTHLILEINSGEIRFVDPRRFGGVFWLGQNETTENNLGPEPLEMRPGELAKRLHKTRRAIKTALLDQSIVAGIGNIYADESLFTAKIDPRIPANRLTTEQIGRLNRSIKTVLRRALRHRGSTLRDYRNADGQPGDFQKLHRVYDRKGQPCVVCKTKIVRIVLGGRSTHFCPRCQTKRPQ
jgi:formamidopyrimidine-DNA glycosylase